MACTAENKADIVRAGGLDALAAVLVSDLDFGKETVGTTLAQLADAANFDDMLVGSIRNKKL